MRRDGTRVPISISSTLIETDGRPTAVLAVIHDLSERKRASNALLESEQRFRGSFESAAIGMALVAPDGRFLEVNRPSANRRLRRGDASSLTFQEITHPDDLELDLDNVRRMLAGEISSYQMEKRYLHATRTSRLGRSSASRSSAAPTARRCTSSPDPGHHEQKTALRRARASAGAAPGGAALAQIGGWGTARRRDGR